MLSPKWQMNDVLIVLPGITGSVLEKDGRECWAPAPTGLLNYALSFGQSIDWLRIRDEDPEADDGIRATHLIPFTVVPGLERFDGYTGLKSHLFAKFDLSVGDANDEGGRPANYFEFPYDWRRDNRLIARRLKRLVDRELPKWRAHKDNPDAKLILLGHSMGGLIARYYVEVLEGFENTKALVTFGTPHRGSVNAIDYLANGYRKCGRTLSQFTSAMRSFTSVYQLLPRYEAVRDKDGLWKAVSHATIENIDQAKAKDAAAFYREIDEAYDRNKGLDEYNVELLPIFGWGHKTLQSAAVMPNLTVEITDQLPPSVEPVFANGDGTVPRVSAIPIDLNDKPLRWWPINQKHATLQNNKDLIANLSQTLAALQGSLRVPARALPGVNPDRQIDLQLDDVYSLDELVSVKVVIHSDRDPGGVHAVIRAVTGNGHYDVPLAHDGNAWVGACPALPPGTYRAAVRLQNEAAGPPDAVADLFEVLPQNS